MTEPRHTRREDRRALVDAGKRYHAAKLAVADPTRGLWVVPRLWELLKSVFAVLDAAEVYAIGRPRVRKPKPVTVAEITARVMKEHEPALAYLADK